MRKNMDILSLDMNFRAQVSEFIPCHRLSISIYVYLSFQGISPHLRNRAHIGTCLTELFWGVQGSHKGKPWEHSQADCQNPGSSCCHTPLQLLRAGNLVFLLCLMLLKFIPVPPLRNLTLSTGSACRHCCLQVRDGVSSASEQPPMSWASCFRGTSRD